MKLVAVGASYGGLYALMEMLGALPTDFPCPIVIAQHRAPDSSDSERLGGVLSRYSAIPVHDADHDERIAGPGVYLAPPDYHLLVEDGRFALDVEGYVHHSRPSIDVLFESAARAYGAEAVGVLLTGFGKDGTAGMAAIQAAGGVTIAQDPESALEGKMPRNAIEAGVASEVLHLDAIAARLMELREVTV